MDNIEQAFQKVPRSKFLSDYNDGEAALDMPLPIGFGQTNSQPTTVKWMLEWLEPQPGDKVLDIGSGSGWTAALLAHLVGPKGKVYAVEIVPELVEFGRQNAQRLNISNAEFYQAGDQYGLSKFAPYDRILVSAAASELPVELLDQLKPGGKMVIPVQSDILEIEKLADDKYEVKRHPGFVFVPLV
ncbi:MAG: Protein-L-isoaspartate (D-aspartate) O-methyltransferase [Candidatus Saccharibacteria bacterium]|nr:Protein-L-isoaspartate (D-aspartate) O-methyltransferase [Candidatus Saccharibacteria bacterium]